MTYLRLSRLNSSKLYKKYNNKEKKIEATTKIKNQTDSNKFNTLPKKISHSSNVCFIPNCTNRNANSSTKSNYHIE